jgi:hypothetical protein
MCERSSDELGESFGKGRESGWVGPHEVNPQNRGTEEFRQWNCFGLPTYLRLLPILLRLAVCVDWGGTLLTKCKMRSAKNDRKSTRQQDARPYSLTQGSRRVYPQNHLS